MAKIRVSTVFTVVALLAGTAATVTAQAPEPEPDTREAVVEQAQAAKVTTEHPYVPTGGERLMDKVQSILNGTLEDKPVDVRERGGDGRRGQGA